MASPTTCSNCGGTFVPKTLLAINLGRKRLVRCPHCRKWTDANAPPPPAPDEDRPGIVHDENEALRRRIEESRLEEIR
jgi:MoaA/NifB/PqqE/SkfB family radical SAM enzyme